jgi:hypothetical protein
MSYALLAMGVYGERHRDNRFFRIFSFFKIKSRIAIIYIEVSIGIQNTLHY